MEKCRIVASEWQFASDVLCFSVCREGACRLWLGCGIRLGGTLCSVLTGGSCRVARLASECSIKCHITDVPGTLPDSSLLTHSNISMTPQLFELTYLTFENKASIRSAT